MQRMSGQSGPKQPKRIDVHLHLERIDLHVHIPALAELAALAIRGFHDIKQEIKTMSGSLADQLAAAQAETSAALDGIATDVAEIGADVDQLLQGAAPGTVLTQEMVDSMTAIRDRAVAAKSALDAVNAKVPPVAVP